MLSAINHRDNKVSITEHLFIGEVIQFDNLSNNIIEGDWVEKLRYINDTDIANFIASDSSRSINPITEETLKNILNEARSISQKSAKMDLNDVFGGLGNGINDKREMRVLKSFIGFFDLERKLGDFSFKNILQSQPYFFDSYITAYANAYNLDTAQKNNLTTFINKFIAIEKDQ